MHKHVCVCVLVTVEAHPESMEVSVLAVTALEHQRMGVNVLMNASA